MIAIYILGVIIFYIIYMASAGSKLIEGGERQIIVNAFGFVTGVVWPVLVLVFILMCISEIVNVLSRIEL